jgi:hypothetical protein
MSIGGRVRRLEERRAADTAAPWGYLVCFPDGRRVVRLFAWSRGDHLAELGEAEYRRRWPDGGRITQAYAADERGDCPMEWI